MITQAKAYHKVHFIRSIAFNDVLSELILSVTNDMSMASFSMEMIFFGLEVLKDGFVQSTLGLNFEEVFS